MSAFVGERLARETQLHERTHGLLREAIISGQFQAGERLVETMISEKLGVSRTPVREAIRRLAQEGWLVVLPHGGVMVRPLVAEDVVDAYRARAVLEGLAARLACERPDDAKLDQLHRAVDEAEAELEAGNLAQVSNLNVESFHYAVVDMSNSPRLIALMESLRIYSVYYRRLVLAAAQTPDARRIHVAYQRERLSDHRSLLSMIAEGRASEAEAFMRRHVEHNAVHAVRMLGLSASPKAPSGIS